MLRKSKLSAMTAWVSKHCDKVSNLEYIGVRSELGELKHLSTRRKGHQPRLRK